MPKQASILYKNYYNFSIHMFVKVLVLKYNILSVFGLNKSD